MSLEEEEEEEEGGYYVHTSTENVTSTTSIEQQSCNNSFRKSGEEEEEEDVFPQPNSQQHSGHPPYPGACPLLIPTSDNLEYSRLTLDTTNNGAVVCRMRKFI
jgi:hypothetical protein